MEPGNAQGAWPAIALVAVRLQYEKSAREGAVRSGDALRARLLRGRGQHFPQRGRIEHRLDLGRADRRAEQEALCLVEIPFPGDEVELLDRLDALHRHPHAELCD